MKLKYIEENVIKTKELKKISIFYAKNGAGKSRHMKFLHDGFSGKGSNPFIVDGIDVDKTLFNVTLLDTEYKYDDFLKFKAKGLMFKDFEESVLSEKEEEIKEYISKINDIFVNEVNSNFFEKVNAKTSLISANIDIGILDFKKVYEELFKINFNTEPTMSSKIELTLKYLLIHRDIAKANIFIIDDFDSYFDEKMTDEILDFFNQQENCYFILSTNQCKSISKAIEIKADIHLGIAHNIDFDNCFKYSYIKEQFISEGEKDFDLYYQDNIRFVTEDDINKVYRTLKATLPYVLNRIITKSTIDINMHKYMEGFIEIVLSITN